MLEIAKWTGLNIHDMYTINSHSVSRQFMARILIMEVHNLIYVISLITYTNSRDRTKWRSNQPDKSEKYIILFLIHTFRICSVLDELLMIQILIILNIIGSLYYSTFSQNFDSCILSCWWVLDGFIYSCKFKTHKTNRVCV